jgi:hypothetical protein
MKNEEFIKSYVRLKPLFQEESPVLSSNEREVLISKSKETFFFSITSHHLDKVFSDSAQNEEIYNHAVKPIMADLLNGFNGREVLI